MENSTDKLSPTNDDTSVKKERSAHKMSHIKGWGIDANPNNDPTYPMRTRANEDTKTNNWARPTQQPITTEILHSNERPDITAVYGTSAPPSGLSGIIRRFAFNYSEGKFCHWLSLLLADRVNVVEGLVADVTTGHLPNVFTEKGMKAEWKHNPQAVVTKVVIGVAVITTIALVLNRKKHR